MAADNKKAQEERFSNDLKKEKAIQKYYQEHPDDEDAFLALVSSTARVSASAAALIALGVPGVGLLAGPWALLGVAGTAMSGGALGMVRKKRKKGGKDISASLSEAVDEFGAAEVVEKVINTPERKSAYLSATIATSEDGPTISNSLALDPELLKEMYRDIKELKKSQEETNRGIEQLSGQIASLSQQIAPCQELACSLLDSLDDGREDSPVAEKIYASFSDVCASIVTKRFTREGPQNDDIRRESRVQLKSFFSDAIWNRLSDETQMSLISAKATYDTFIRMDDSNTLDYTGVCALVSKALEIECRKYFFERFRLYAKEHPQWSIPPEQQEALGLLAKGHFFTLGSVQYIIPIFDEKPEVYQEYRELLLAYARERLFSESFLADLPNDGSILERLDQYRAAVKHVKNKYRNRGVHGDAVSRQSATECLEYVVEVERVLAKMVGAFRD